MVCIKSSRLRYFAGLIALSCPDLTLAQDLTSWLGTFRGNCQNQRPGDNSQRVDFTMERTVTPIAGSNRYQWRSTYNGGTADSGKNYQLVPINPARGYYQIDEGGGVRIDTYLSGNSFYSHFSVGSVQITSVERLIGDQLTMELLSFDALVQSSGASVNSFRFQLNQRCVLQRM